jgi:protein-S-isoprenylcysteine O-methyltransferase Ste14
MSARVWAWLGGALFVVALAVCGWWYLFVLGRSTPAVSARAIVVDVGLFALFALHHSVFARDFVKRLFGSTAPQHVRSAYVFAASALLILVCAAWRPVGGHLYEASGAGAASLIVVQLAGIWIIARAVARIDPLELAGIRPVSTDDPLQTSGVYGWVRHPIYLGWTLAVFGTPHMTGDRLTFAAVSTLYLALAVPFEERSLARSFGEEYVRYRGAVKWRMLPFIY